MTTHLTRAMHKIKKEILSLGAMVEDRFKKSIYAIKSNDFDLAIQIIETDYLVDAQEIEVEEECLKTLALCHPVATDLRLITAVIKINNDLERIADYAVNIARRFQAGGQGSNPFKYDYTAMAEQAAKMLKLSLDALVSLDGNLAYKVREMDEDVNAMRNDAYRVMTDAIRKNPENVEEIINMYLISRHIERVGDHTKNIAEEVIYLIDGEIIRHT
ncbi:phosphate signaling complex protein PhoU [uncultured Desulfobacter sp.]|uniref:phosphate signaling complex protein PhoU n=1 Tax=uncultured Desulfobacter sp. TaxID=240139 RepID=UPI002AAB8BB8|nr:phosphate signaling complex protein PhoU [uncultured Desulfobacter sp.]